MKTMMNFRKFCSAVAAVLTVALCLAMLPAKVQAAGAYTVRLTDTAGNKVITTYPGGTVTLVLKLENNPGIIGVGVQMKYPNGFSLAETPRNVSGFNDVASGYFIPSQHLSTNPYLMWWNYALGDYDQKLITVEGDLARIQFTVAKNVTPGDYSITLTAPADKNTTADTNAAGGILPNTNKPISLATVGCTIRVANSCNHSFGAWTYVSGDAPSCTADGSQSRSCGLCGRVETRYVDAKGHSYVQGVCTKCSGTKQSVRGDIDGNGIVNGNDAFRLLLHVSMPSAFPVTEQTDLTADGRTTTADVIHLLLHVSLPGLFPL